MTVVSAALALLVVAGSVLGFQDKGAGNDLAQLGETLKAAVLSGTLTEAEAWKIYETFSRRLRGVEKEKPPSDVQRLVTPQPGQVRELLQPEFLRRDLPLLQETLELDEGQQMIVEVLLIDYVDAIDLATTPLREALTLYRHAEVDRWMATVLDSAKIENVEALVEATREELTRIEQDFETDIADKPADLAAKRAEFDRWSHRLIEVTVNLEDRLAHLRRRVHDEMQQLQAVTVTAPDLVEMAEQLFHVRTELRMALIADLALATTEQQRGDDGGRFVAAIGRVWIARRLPNGRLGGESMDPWRALRETSAELDDARAVLDDRIDPIAEQLELRTFATIRREMIGLEVQAGGDADRYREAIDRELEASVTVRDTLMVLMAECATHLEQSYPGSGLSETFHDNALRLGFPVEMRPRWSQRAVAAALELADLDEETLEALETLDDHTATALETLRLGAVAKRMHRDPLLVAGEIEWAKDVWLGVSHRQFASLDDATERRLLALLTPDQVTQLPQRRKK